eukprot:Hpha_TRINITY_DN22839_c0_g1::TRINITY_DN22839_c0_g1_i1::g.84426::m.84426
MQGGPGVGMQCLGGRPPGQLAPSSDLALQSVSAAIQHLTDLLRVACHGVSVGVGFWTTYTQLRTSMPELLGPSAPEGSSSRRDPRNTPAPGSSSFARRCVRQLATWLLVALLYTLATKLWKSLTGGGQEGRVAAREVAPRLGQDGREELRAIFELSATC